MTATLLPETRPDSRESDHDDDLTHWVCCDPTTAMCGADVTHEEFVTLGQVERVCPECDLANRLDLGCAVCQPACTC